MLPGSGSGPKLSQNSGFESKFNVFGSTTLLEEQKNNMGFQDNFKIMSLGKRLPSGKQYSEPAGKKNPTIESLPDVAFGSFSVGMWVMAPGLGGRMDFSYIRNWLTWPVARRCPPSYSSPATWRGTRTRGTISRYEMMYYYTSQISKKLSILHNISHIFRKFKLNISGEKWLMGNGFVVSAFQIKIWSNKLCKNKQ